MRRLLLVVVLLVATATEALTPFQLAQQELTSAAASTPRYFSFSEAPSSPYRTGGGLVELDRQEEDVAIAESRVYKTLARLENRRRALSIHGLQPKDCSGCCETVYNLANRVDTGLLLQYYFNSENPADGEEAGSLYRKALNLMDRDAKELNLATLLEQKVSDSALNANMIFKVMANKDLSVKSDFEGAILASQPGEAVIDRMYYLAHRNENLVIAVKENCSKHPHTFVIQEVMAKEAEPTFRVFSSYNSKFRLIDFLNHFPLSTYKGPVVNQNGEKLVKVTGSRVLTKSELMTWFSDLINMFEEQVRKSREMTKMRRMKQKIAKPSRASSHEDDKPNVEKKAMNGLLPNIPDTTVPAAPASSPSSPSSPTIVFVHPNNNNNNNNLNNNNLNNNNHKHLRQKKKHTGKKKPAPPKPRSKADMFYDLYWGGLSNSSDSSIAESEQLEKCEVQVLHAYFDDKVCPANYKKVLQWVRNVLKGEKASKELIDFAGSEARNVNFESPATTKNNGLPNSKQNKEVATKTPNNEMKGKKTPMQSKA